MGGGYKINAQPVFLLGWPADQGFSFANPKHSTLFKALVLLLRVTKVTAFFLLYPENHSFGGQCCVKINTYFMPPFFIGSSQINF